MPPSLFFFITEYSQATMFTAESISIIVKSWKTGICWGQVLQWLIMLEARVWWE